MLTVARLLIYPDQLSPDDITRRLSIEPTKTSVAGEIRVNRLGLKRTVKSSTWILSSEGRVDSKDLRRHLDWLLACLRPTQAAIHTLQTIAGVRMGIDCLWESRGGQGGPTLSPEQMRAMAELDLECSFNIEFYGNETISEAQAVAMSSATRLRSKPTM